MRLMIIWPYDPAAVRGTVIDLGKVLGVEGPGRSEQKKLTVTLCCCITWNTLYHHNTCISKTLILCVCINIYENVPRTYHRERAPHRSRQHSSVLRHRRQIEEHMRLHQHKPSVLLDNSLQWLTADAPLLQTRTTIFTFKLIRHFYKYLNAYL